MDWETALEIAPVLAPVLTSLVALFAAWPTLVFVFKKRHLHQFKKDAAGNPKLEKMAAQWHYQASVQDFADRNLSMKEIEDVELLSELELFTREEIRVIAKYAKPDNFLKFPVSLAALVEAFGVAILSLLSLLLIVFAAMAGNIMRWELWVTVIFTLVVFVGSLKVAGDSIKYLRRRLDWHSRVIKSLSSNCRCTVQKSSSEAKE